MINSTSEQPDSLPYHDTKPVGAADFYFAINATFRFIRARLGEAGLHRYWNQLGMEYMTPVWQRWKAQGLSGIATYWRAFFDAEPGSKVKVKLEEKRVVLEVRICPAIRHLREHQREIVPDFCQHCYFVSEAAAQNAGYTMRLFGGNGSCRQEFHPTTANIAPQRMVDITEAR